MAIDSSSIYRDTVDFVDCIVGDYEFYRKLIAVIGKGEGSLALKRKVLKKHIDECWVAAIEESLPALDQVVRAPRRDIREEEEILPIELSRNIGPKSIRHLSQHTNMISRIEDDGTIIPSQILNIYKEETLDTYENKFVNTLVNRLYMFVNSRYDKLSQYGNDESGNELDYETTMHTGKTEVNLRLHIETKDTLDIKTTSRRASEENSLWDRTVRMRKIVNDYMTSPFVEKMGRSYIRPPIMRTNAIMKNQNLRQCLTLWQFIESYDKVGFEIEAEESTARPKKEMVSELYSLLAFQYVVFRQHTYGNLEKEGAIKTRGSKRTISPRIIREFEEISSDDYNFYEVEQKKVLAVFPGAERRKLTAGEIKIRTAITAALTDEKRYKSELKKLQRLENNKVKNKDTK